MGKILSRSLLALYLLMLIWLVLFKLTFDIPSVFDYHHRSLNLIPFGAASFVNGSYREMIDNAVIFIPFGLLLKVNFKKSRILTEFAVIAVFSLAVELIQLDRIIILTGAILLALLLYYRIFFIKIRY